MIGFALLRSRFAAALESPIAKRLAKGTLWTLAGAVVSRGLTLVGSMLIARMLGKTGFGELGMVQNTMGLFGVFAGLGMGLTATKYIAESRTTDPAKAGRVLALTELATLGTGLVLMLALWLSADYLARTALASPTIARPLQLGALLLPVSAFNGVQLGALAGFEAFRSIAKASLLSGIAGFPILLALTYTWGIDGAVLGLVGAQAVGLAINHAFLRGAAARYSIRPAWRDAFREIRALWNFSFPAFLGSVFGWAGNWGSSVILVQQVHGYAELGVVNASSQWRAALMFLPGLLANVTLPMLANQKAGDADGTDFQKTLALSHRALSWVVLPLVGILMLGAEPILSLYGPGFAEGRATLILVLAGATISAVSSPAGSALIAHGWMWFALALNSANAVVLVGLCYWTAPRLGSAALGLGFMMGHLTQATAGYLGLRRSLPPGMLWRNLVMILAIAALAIGLSWTSL